MSSNLVISNEDFHRLISLLKEATSSLGEHASNLQLEGYDDDAQNIRDQCHDITVALEEIHLNLSRAEKDTGDWYCKGQCLPSGTDCEVFVEPRWVQAHVVGFDRAGNVVIDVFS